MMPVPRLDLRRLKGPAADFVVPVGCVVVAETVWVATRSSAPPWGFTGAMVALLTASGAVWSIVWASRMWGRALVPYRRLGDAGKLATVLRYLGGALLLLADAACGVLCAGPVMGARAVGVPLSPSVFARCLIAAWAVLWASARVVLSLADAAECRSPRWRERAYAVLLLAASALVGVGLVICFPVRQVGLIRHVAPGLAFVVALAAAFRLDRVQQAIAGQVVEGNLTGSVR